MKALKQQRQAGPGRKRRGHGEMTSRVGVGKRLFHHLSRRDGTAAVPTTATTVFTTSDHTQRSAYRPTYDASNPANTTHAANATRYICQLDFMFILLYAMKQGMKPSHPIPSHPIPSRPVPSHPNRVPSRRSIDGAPLPPPSPAFSPPHRAV